MPESSAGLAPDGRPWSVVLSQAGRAELARLVREYLSLFTEREVLQALRHPYVSREVIEEVLGATRFLAVREVRKALALHPVTPRADALASLENLAWHDLMEIGRQTRALPPVRRAANQRILLLLPRLALGERISLARHADRDLFGALLEQKEPAVFEALLTNPRLSPEDLVKWIVVGQPDEGRLAIVAKSPRWASRPAVRSALLRQRRTPRGLALSLLTAATRVEWGALMEDPQADPLLAECARRLYDQERN